MRSRRTRPYFFLAALAALFVIPASLNGLLSAGQALAPGQRQPMVAGQELVIVLAAPLMVLALWAAHRGSLRARLLTAGLMGFYFYSYSAHAFERLHTAYFPLYLAVAALSFYGLAGLLATMDMERFTQGLKPAFPARFIGGLLIMSAPLAPLWINRAALSNQPEGLTFILQLLLVLPGFLLTGVWTWRRKNYGLVAASVVLVKILALCLTLLAGALFKLALNMPVDLGSALLFLLLAMAYTLAVWLYFANLRPGPAGAP